MKTLSNNMEKTQVPIKQTRSGWFVYPLLSLHLAAFGYGAFMMAYSSNPAPILVQYLAAAFAIHLYIKFYIQYFGLDEVKWMIINACLGILGIYGEIGWLLSKFGKEISDYPVYFHLAPFTYFILFTFLFRQLVLDITFSRQNEKRKQIVERVYVCTLLIIYAVVIFSGHHLASSGMA